MNTHRSATKPPIATRYVSVSLLILFLGLSAALQYKVRFAGAGSASKGGLALKARAPDLKLTDADSRTISLDNFKGQIVILDFWATWCLPCRSEFIELKGWIERRKKESKWQDIAVVAVNLAEDPATVTQFVQEQKLPFTVLLDRDGSVAKQYNVQALPSLFVIDGVGVIRNFQEGYKPGLGVVLDKLIEDIRKEASP